MRAGRCAVLSSATNARAEPRALDRLLFKALSESLLAVGLMRMLLLTKLNSNSVSCSVSGAS